MNSFNIGFLITTGIVSILALSSLVFAYYYKKSKEELLQHMIAFAFLLILILICIYGLI